MLRPLLMTRQRRRQIRRSRKKCRREISFSSERLLHRSMFRTLIVIYSTDDMLAILFPHLFEDIEYLLPEDEGMDVDSGPSLQLSQDGVRSGRRVAIGEAGPSGHH